MAPAKVDIWEYDSPADPKFSAMVPSGFGPDRPVFNPDEPPYEVEKESVSVLRAPLNWLQNTPSRCHQPVVHSYALGLTLAPTLLWRSSLPLLLRHHH